MKRKYGIVWFVVGLLGATVSAQGGVQGAPSQSELIPRCVPTVHDEATGNCLTASSVPELGKLYPLGPDFSIAPGVVRVGGTLDVESFVLADDIYINGSGTFQSILIGLAALTPPSGLMIRKGGAAEIVLEADVINTNEFAHPRIVFSQDGGAVVSTIGFRNGGNEFSITNEFDADQRFNLPVGNADWEFWKLSGLFSNRLAYINQDGNMAIDGNYSSGGADVAEYYPVRGSVEPGDVVAFTGEGLAIARAVSGAGGRLAGIVSTDPGVVLGLTYTDEEETGENPEDLCAGDRLAAIRHEIQVNRRAPLALTGRVPCKVTAENGPIQPGDLLTVSSLPGLAMKATHSGAVLGTALEGWGAGEGSILVLANLGHFSPTADLEQRVKEQDARIRALERRLEALARR